MKRAMLWMAGMAAATAQAQVQTPPAIKEAIDQIEQKFSLLLEDECDDESCYSIGCEVTKFNTLDQKEVSSLPGFNDDVPAEAVSYKLASAVCEYAHEPALTKEQVDNLTARLKQKITSPGVIIQIRPKALKPKIEEEEPGVIPKDKTVTTNDFWREFLPFAPWLITLFVVSLIGYGWIWAFRRLGRQKKKEGSKVTTALALADGNGIPAEPSTEDIDERIKNLKNDLVSDPSLVGHLLKFDFGSDNIGELCLFLRYFGPELLQPYKEVEEYKDLLTQLSREYSNRASDQTVNEVWRFLDRVDKAITAAKVRIDYKPLVEEFLFLASLDVEEFLLMLREVSEKEAIAAVSHAPHKLRETFFAQANPQFTSKFIDYLTSVEKMPDQFVRATAIKLRQIHETKGGEIRTAKIDRVPLLEQALNALTPDARRNVIENIAREKPELMKDIGANVFLDESVLYMSTAVLNDAFLTISPKEAAAFLGAHLWGDKALAKLDPRLKESIEKQRTTAVLSNTALQTDAREKLANYIKQLHLGGKVDLVSINSKLLGKS
ncbi:MAG: hypothetical protein AB7T49_13240 [Oligoflexales bacterium]